MMDAAGTTGAWIFLWTLLGVVLAVTGGVLVARVLSSRYSAGPRQIPAAGSPGRPEARDAFAAALCSPPRCQGAAPRSSRHGPRRHPVHLLGCHLQRHHRDPPGCSSSWVVSPRPRRTKVCTSGPSSWRAGGQGKCPAADLAGRPGGLLSPGRLGRALAARRGRPGRARGHRPGGPHRLLVVHELVPAGGTCSRPPSPRPCPGWAWGQCSQRPRVRPAACG
jgi:hypothetical protein